MMHRVSPQRQAALMLVSSAAISAAGCASPLGRPHYACEGMPGRPLCLSVVEVYQRTEGNGPPPVEVLAREEEAR